MEMALWMVLVLGMIGAPIALGWLAWKNAGDPPPDLPKQP